MNTQDTDREELVDNDRIYQNLMHIHRSEHISDDCFCTTEVSGAYKNILDEIEKSLASQRKAAEIEMQLKALDHIIEIEDKTFNRWSQKDIANFFDGVGKYYRELQAEKEAMK